MHARAHQHHALPTLDHPNLIFLQITSKHPPNTKAFLWSAQPQRHHRALRETQPAVPTTVALMVNVMFTHHREKAHPLLKPFLKERHRNLL